MSKTDEASPALGCGGLVRLPGFHFSRMARPTIVASVKTGGLVTNRERVRFPYACPFLPNAMMSRDGA